MYCSRCGNDEEVLFKTTKKGTYCLKCARFGKYYINNAKKNILKINEIGNPNYHLPYELSVNQLKCARELVDFVRNNHDVLVYAACGAGKTEISMPLITYALENKKKVAVAIPRKEVVIELCTRYQAAYPALKVISVYGEHHNEIDGDLIIMTTHQLYRYEKAFDVLIIDEVDAFPFAGNEILEHMVEYACCGNKVYLTATPSLKLKEDVTQGKLKQVSLFVRPHGGKLCVPKVVIGYKWYLWLHLFRFIYKHQSKTILLFVPTIKLANQFYLFFKPFISCVIVTSQSSNREVLNERLKKHEYHLIIATTVLERGITIGDVQVVIYDATHIVFDEASLIQISGRVGRKEYAKEGDCLFLCRKRSVIIEQAIASIEMMNNG